MLITALEQVKTSETHCQHNCAESVKLAVKKAGLDDSLFSVSCTETRRLLIGSADWVEVTDREYQRNDIILFDWDKSGDCDHIGIIRDSNDNIISYDDFNSSQNPRGYYKGHVMNVSNTSIANVFRYKEAGATPTVYKNKKLELEKGDGGAIVKLIQAIVQVETDGKFGNDTDGAVREFQKFMECEVDGVVGNETFTAMAEYVKELIERDNK